MDSPGNPCGHETLGWEMRWQKDVLWIQLIRITLSVTLGGSSQSMDSVKNLCRASSASWLFHSLWSLIIVILCWNHRRLIIVALWPWSGFLGFQTWGWPFKLETDTHFYVSMDKPVACSSVPGLVGDPEAPALRRPLGSHSIAAALAPSSDPYE